MDARIMETNNHSCLVLVRHGESTYNEQNRFTGWENVDLTQKGRDQALEAGLILKDIQFNHAYTSVLTRAQETLSLILSKNKHSKVGITNNMALNERDYGSLVGQNKKEAALKFGEEQVQIWRRSYDVPPPGGESLKITAGRTIPYFKNVIMPKVTSKKNILIAAHGNSIRSIVMDLLKLSPQQILKTEIGWCEPWIFTFKENQSIDSFKILTRHSEVSKSYLPDGVKEIEKTD